MALKLKRVKNHFVLENKKFNDFQQTFYWNRILSIGKNQNTMSMLNQYRPIYEF